MAEGRSARPTIGDSRRLAANLLRQFRCGQRDALDLVAEHHPDPERFSSIRHAQSVIARASGHEDWTDLCRSVEDSIDRDSTLAECADLFAELACLSYSGNDHVDRRKRASQLLVANPELTTADPSAAAAAFDCEALAAHIENDVRLVTATSGPRDWSPLLYVCYSRVSEHRPYRDALAAMMLLLEAGASGNTVFVADELGGWHWSALTGVMGEGENGVLQQPPHARAREMAEMLLDAGADPNDSQGLYNTMFTAGNEWLELLLDRGLDASNSVFPGRDEQKTLDYQLSQAVKSRLSDRVVLLLDHGADPAGTDRYSQRSNYENAVLAGSPGLADLLVRYGAEAVELSAGDRFVAAAMRGAENEARLLLDEEPELIANAELLFAAVDNPEATRLLLALGVDPNQPNGDGGRVALHEAAWFGRREVVELLLAAGASCDIRDEYHYATPIGFADHAGHFATRDLLLDHSQDVFELIHYGRTEQVRDVLERAPERARTRLRGGYTPLHRLHSASGECEQLVDLLLGAGADIDAVAGDGMTSLDLALERDDEVLVGLLRSRGAKG